MASTSSRRDSESSVRGQLACLRCRQRKSFCSKEIPACLPCREKGHVCVYPDGRKKTVLASYIHDLEARVKAYESASDTSATATSPPHSSPLNFSSNDETPRHTLEDNDLDTNPLVGDFANLVLSSSGKPQYLGNSSSTILGRRLRDLVGCINSDNQADDIDRELSTYNHAALKVRQLSIAENIKLPPMSIARRLFAAQFTYIGTIFAFVQPELFEKQLRQAYLGPPAAQDRDACLSYCQVLLILGFGQLYDVNTWISVEGPPGFEYFTHALHFLPDMHEEGSVLFVGVLALSGYFLQNLRRMDAAFLYMGNALRMAISLALHQEVSTQGLDENMKEYRRRTWWSVYSLDRILCVKSGNPVSIQDEDIGVALPSRLPHEEPYCAAVVLRHYTELSRILGQIMQKIYRRTPKSGSRLMAAVQEIMAALVHWRANIPAELYFDPAKLHTTRESVSTFLHYYQCINMTARPLLFHVVQKRLQGTEADRMQDWKQGLSLATVKIIETCVDGARDTITMMSIAAQQGLCATFGYMDGEHAFSAAIVLVMVCFAFPCTAADVTAMNVALDLLGSMAERGNQAIAARHKLLVNLRSLITPPQTLNEPSEISTDNLPADPILVATPGLLLDDSALEEMLADDSDIHFWEEGYTNPDLDMDYDLTQWTQAVQNNYGNIAM